MLGKIVGGLFWMFCYFECVENIVCLFEVGWYIVLMCLDGVFNEWQLIIIIVGMNVVYFEKYDSYEVGQVINFML